MTRYNYRMEYDTIHNKIIADEVTDEACREYSFYNGDLDARGYGVIATTREMCMKKLKRMINHDIKELEKEIHRYTKMLNKLEKEIGNVSNN